MKIARALSARRSSTVETVPRYGALTYWQASAQPRTPRRFSSKERYDVIIVGGGFTGLWTAHHLLAQQPNLSIAILEKGEIGYGASGRNGGFAMPLFHHSLHNLVREVGLDGARALHALATNAVDGLCSAIKVSGIDCDLDRSGLLVVATNDHQERKIRRDMEAAETISASDVRLLDRIELQGRIHSPIYRLGMEQDGCATVHPLKLVRGLAATVEKRGAHVYESFGVEEIEAVAGGVSVRGGKQRLFGNKAVLALNAWSSAMTPVARDVMPVYSYIIATEPISDDRWSTIGWGRRYGVEDKRYHVHFYRRTVDNRILWGGRRAKSSIRAHIVPGMDSDPEVFRLLAESFIETFPQLADIRFTHGWGGPIGVTVNQLPTFGTLSGGRLHYGHGYCGHGVGPSFLGGQILADLVNDRKSACTELPFVNRPHGRWPSEPWRTWGMITALRETYWRDETAHAGRPFREPLMMRLGRQFFLRRAR